MGYPPFSTNKSDNNETWEIRDRVMGLIMDSIPTETAADNIARELNRAYSRGCAAALEVMRQAFGRH